MTLHYRNINALFPKKLRKYIKKSHLAFHLRNFFLIVFGLTALIQIQMLFGLGMEHKSLLKERDKRLREYDYWVSAANQFPNIPDILYNASVVSLNVGKEERALSFLDKTLRIDPLFEEAQKLRDKLVD